MRNEGIEKWYNKCRGGSEANSACTIACQGPSPKKYKGKSIYDNNGNKYGFHSAEVRLHNLVMDLSDVLAQEDAWERRHPHEANTMTIRTQYSATNALAIYKQFVNEGAIDRVEQASMKACTKRGLEWEAAAHSDYPVGEELDETRHTKLKANITQRKFIRDQVRRSKKPYSKEDKYGAEPPSKRKRRCTDAKVSWNTETYIHEEANFDRLRLEYW
ncbi:hypothetical protein DE146DRAFT_758523 [Phaeosphaeria sp. MPI-PUGE-AT-0046c]|nr:hypothetical protein DE146DRAFT_758523 [Phaeosphaeria sp. MPI-PUGE-AT-0046c]